MNSGNSNPVGKLTSQIKDRLIQQALERRTKQFDREIERREAGESSSDSKFPLHEGVIPEDWTRLDRHPGYQRIRIIREGAARLGIPNPFFQVHEGQAGVTTRIGSQEMLNFSSYNYLGLCGHPKVNAAATEAIQQFGTSVSASRIVSGERPLHQELEKEIATAYGSEDAVVMVSGHATTVTTIGYLFGPRDLILHDSLIHNCAVEGIRLSGAKRIPFPHNDWNALDEILSNCRHKYERVLIIIEGLYSMDGDYPELPHFVALKRKHHAFLMVDEAHSFGVLGENGMGIREQFDLDSTDVDIWMGTLSKTFAGCGGFIAGDADLIEHLKFAAPGFVYSVGMSPPVCAASLAALRILKEEPERVHRLQKRSELFLSLMREEGCNVGLSKGIAIVPLITASSLKATRLSNRLAEAGINAQPILYPAVPENAARVRFFLSCEHSEDQIRFCAETVGKALRAT